MGVARAGRRHEVPLDGDLGVHALELVGELAVRLALEDVVLVDSLLEEVRPLVESRGCLVVGGADGCRPRAGLDHLDVVRLEGLAGEGLPLDEVDEMGRHVNDGLALLVGVVVPARTLQRLAVHELAEVVHGDLRDRGIVRCALLLLAIEILRGDEGALEDRGDLVALGHDVGEVESLLVRQLRRLADLCVGIGRDDHRFVGEHVEAGLDGLEVVVALLVVFAGQHHDGPRLVGGKGLLQIVVSRVDDLVPGGGILLAGIERGDKLLVGLDIRPLWREHADLLRHALVGTVQDQRGMEMARIELDELDFTHGLPPGGLRAAVAASREQRGQGTSNQNLLHFIPFGGYGDILP